MEYLVERVLNNNVIIVQADHQGEQILVGKGIGFSLKRGERLDARNVNIEKRFTLVSEENKSHFQQLFVSVPPEVVGVAEEIITLATDVLKCQMHEHIHVALADHIGFALTRLSGNLEIRNPFLDEIRLLYWQEWGVAQQGGRLIEERFRVSIPDDEVGFLTLHIHSATHSQGLSETVRITDAINMAVQAIERAMGTKLPRRQLNYARMVAHLRYAIQRILHDQSIDNPLADAVKEKLPDSYSVAMQAAKEISVRIKKTVPEDEVSYLAMHVERLKTATQESLEQ